MSDFRTMLPMIAKFPTDSEMGTVTRNKVKTSNFLLFHATEIRTG